MVEVYAFVKIPAHIMLDPEKEGIDWFVKYDTLFYDIKGEQKEYNLGSLCFDGDYKRPEVSIEETEEKKCFWCNGRDCNEDCNSDCEVEEEEDIEAKIQTEIEKQAEILRGK